ncbi:hypothetical protein RJT34_14723 [Clitoria ternatea]|uniref:DUF7650 domain-containing protein n=1 Tax=Clitoria ternatea TaxID=43366 RepID=A0AAN9JT10_CLITE
MHLMKSKMKVDKVQVILPKVGAEESKHDQLIHANKSNEAVNKSNLCIETQNSQIQPEANKSNSAQGKANIELHEEDKLKNHCLVTESSSNIWNEIELAGFTLGLYIFGKDFDGVKKLASRVYQRGPKKQDDLKQYVLTLKELVGLNALIEAVAIGTEKDLTGLPANSTKANAKPVPDIPVFQKHAVRKDYRKLEHDEIINFLTGARLSKSQSNGIFWDVVWPLLLARGWHSKGRDSKKCSVSDDKLHQCFFIPGIDEFSVNLVKGHHYFDCVIDVLNKVASDPKLIEPERVEGNGCKNLGELTKFPNELDKGKMIIATNANELIIRKGVPSHLASSENMPSKRSIGSTDPFAACKHHKRDSLSNTIRRDDLKLKSIQSVFAESSNAENKNVINVSSLECSLKEKNLSDILQSQEHQTSANSLPIVKRQVVLGISASPAVIQPEQQPRFMIDLNKPVSTEDATDDEPFLAQIQKNDTGNVPRFMIDLNKPILIKDDDGESFGAKRQENDKVNESDDPNVEIISEAMYHSYHRLDMNTQRRSARTTKPTRRLLESFSMDLKETKLEWKPWYFVPGKSAKSPGQNGI